MIPMMRSEIDTYLKTFNDENVKAIKALQFLGDIALQVKENMANFSFVSKERNCFVTFKAIVLMAKMLDNFNREVELTINQFDWDFADMVKSSVPDIFNITDNIARPIYDLSAYKIGDLGMCNLTYIKDVDRNLCFIVDLARIADIDKLNLIETATEIPVPPESGIVFGVAVNGKIFRALRCQAERNLMLIRVNLIDVGEVVDLPTFRNTFFELPIAVQKIPAAALLSSIEKIDGNTGSLRSISQKKGFQFKVLNVCVNMLQLELLSPESIIKKETGEAEIDVLEHLEEDVSQHGYLFSIFDNLNNNVDNNSTFELKDVPYDINLNGSGADVAGDFYPICADESTISPIRRTSRMDQLSPLVPQSSYSELNESKSNSMTVWTSDMANNNQTEDLSRSLYVPRYNYSVSRAQFNQTVIKKPSFQLYSGTETHSAATCRRRCGVTCAKGAHPKRAVNSEKQFSAFVRAPYDIPYKKRVLLPSIGQTVPINSTLILNIEEFFAHLDIPGLNTLNELHSALNPTSNRIISQNLTKLPDQWDLVLARYSSDTFIYRAQVNHVKDEKHIQITYVDYGNTEVVPINMLFKWQPFCSSYPFHAVHCRIVNVNKRTESDHEAYNYLTNIMRSTKCSVVIMNIIDGNLEVRLIDNDGFDIGEQLCLRILTVQNKNPQWPYTQMQ